VWFVKLRNALVTYCLAAVPPAAEEASPAAFVKFQLLVDALWTLAPSPQQGWELVTQCLAREILTPNIRCASMQPPWKALQPDRIDSLVAILARFACRSGLLLCGSVSNSHVRCTGACVQPSAASRGVLQSALVGLAKTVVWHAPLLLQLPERPPPPVLHALYGVPAVRPLSHSLPSLWRLLVVNSALVRWRSDTSCSC